MTKRKKAFLAAIVIVSVVLLLMIGLTISYLVDTDAQDNIITIGNVSLKLDEGDYKDNTIADVQQIIEKAPKLENTGNKDEFVFMRVLVPVDNITLLYEQDIYDNNNMLIHREGEIVPDDGKPSDNELFKLLTNDAGTAITADSSFGDIVFSYYEGASTPSYTEGWVQLSGPKDNPITTLVNGNQNTVTKKYHEYIFGYNKMLSPSQKTKTLFDKIQLKSFIDNEVTGEYLVDVSAYGIQTEELGLSGVDENSTQLTKEQLEKIFEIVERKQVLKNE